MEFSSNGCSCSVAVAHVQGHCVQLRALGYCYHINMDPSCCLPWQPSCIKRSMQTSVLMMPMQAENNMNKVFVLIGVFVASTTGVFHACKAVLKFFARRFRIGKVCLGQPLVATADVLLPSAFFGPYIAMYVVAKVAVNVIRRQQVI